MTKSIDQLRRDAKALKTSHAKGDPQAIQRVTLNPPRPDGAPLKHADFLHVIARENRFRSWPDLKAAVELHGMDRADKLQRLKVALAHGLNAQVDRLLADTPDLAEGAFSLQVALLNRDEVSRMLAEDPSRATATHGGKRPILHLAFSRRLQAEPDRADDMIAIAEMLVANGADVNDGYPVAPGSDHRLSALYGAIGHANNMVLARWLLEHGANPNDGESLYHSTELGHHEGLRMLLDHGADPRGTNALLRAMDFNDHAAVRLLLDHGARADDFNPASVGGEEPWVVPALHQAARRMCDAEMIGLLLEAGADPGRLYQGCSAYGYARVFGNLALARAIEDRDLAPDLTPEEELLAAAADDRLTDGARIDPTVLPDVYRNLLRLILHLPGKLPHVRRLVSLGLETDRPDEEGLTPVQVAGWEGLPEVLAYFLSLTPDLSHVNAYGGTLLSTILHGSENNPNRAARDYPACLQMVLEAGVSVPRAAIDFAGNRAMVDVLEIWAEEHPEMLEDHGPY